MVAFKKILVPVDFSPCSKHALEYAVELAAQVGASVDALHVWQTPALVAPDLLVTIPGKPHQPIFDWIQQEAWRNMEDILRKTPRPEKVTVQGRVETGAPALTVKRIAESGGYDLIIMGTHGRTGLTHLLLGSVAEQIVRTATCPVLTVREKK